MQPPSIMSELSDHKDSELFSYNRSWADIEGMLSRAERKLNFHNNAMLNASSKQDRLHHMRNYKALQGVVKTLRWVLGDMRVQHPLD